MLTPILFSSSVAVLPFSVEEVHANADSFIPRLQISLKCPKNKCLNQKSDSKLILKDSWSRDIESCVGSSGPFINDVTQI